MTERHQATSYRVLARKYRPESFSGLIGQDAMVRTLKNAIASGRLAHAFILTGVRGVGKTTTARIIARALNCIGPDGTGGPTAEPCGECEHCVAIAEDRHVDVIEMDAASRTGVDDIRDLIEGVRYRPVSARYKIYIIDEVHMLSKQAFNALLKTLEEPPEHVKFVFATTELRRVPVTVLSRCQRFDLRRVDGETLERHLTEVAERERVRIAPGALALVARAADGSVRDGLSLLDTAIAHGLESAEGTIGEAELRDMLGLADRGRVLDLFEAVMKGDAAASLDILGELYAAGADPAVVMQDLLDVCHALTRLKVAPEAAAPQVADDAPARELAAGLALPELARAWQILLKGLGEVHAAPTPVAAAEMALVRLAYAAELPSPAELVRAARSAEGAAAASPGTAAARAGESGDGRALRTPRTDGAAPAESERANRTRPRAAGGGAQAAEARLAEEQSEQAPDELTAREAEPVAEAADDDVDAGPQSFADVVALFAANREPVLHAHLMGEVHLVRFEPGRIEFRPGPNAPRDLANRMGELLSRWTGTRWVVSVSKEPGAPTLKEQEEAKAARLRREAAAHPAVRAVLDTFPGAAIEAVRERPAQARPEETPGADAHVPLEEEEPS